MENIEVLLTGLHCLVLEDEFLIALDIQQILETAGAARVTCVGTVTDALAVLRGGEKFDLAVLDVKLNGAHRTSFDVATELRRLRIPFIFLTGMRADEISTAQFPAAPVVEKPYQAPLLLEAIAQAFKRR